MYNSNTDIWIAGAVAAVSVDFMVYPFDTLKTRMQSADYDTRYKNPQTGAIRRNVLFRGLYQGVWSVVFATIPACLFPSVSWYLCNSICPMPLLTTVVFVAGAFFTTYEGVKYTLGNLTSTTTGAQHSPQTQNTTYSLLPTPIIHAIASSCGEMVSCLMITPAEVLKQNAQVVHNQGQGRVGRGRRGHVHAGRSVSLEVISRFRNKPWKLWSGYTALVGRNLPFTGLHFPIFEYVRSHFVGWREAKNTSPPEGTGSHWNPLLERVTLTGFAAGFAGTVASVVTTPIDVIKTRMMLAATVSPASTDSSGSGGGDNATKEEKMKKFATLNVGKEIYRKEGIRGLFRGGLLKAGWTALGLGLYLSFYEGGRLYLENRRKDKENGEQKEGDGVV